MVTSAIKCTLYNTDCTKQTICNFYGAFILQNGTCTHGRRYAGERWEKVLAFFPPLSFGRTLCCTHVVPSATVSSFPPWQNEASTSTPLLSLQRRRRRRRRRHPLPPGHRPILLSAPSPGSLRQEEEGDATLRDFSVAWAEREGRGGGVRKRGKKKRNELGKRRERRGPPNQLHPFADRAPD